MTHPYASKEYAQSFAGIAELVQLPVSKTYVMKRTIRDTDFYDLMNCYPRTPIMDINSLIQDFETLKDTDCISLTLAADVFCSVDSLILNSNFEHVLPFKTHYIFNRNKSFQVTKHHRYEIKQANKVCSVKLISLQEALDIWQEQYNQLIVRHSIKGIQQFSPNYFETVSKLPNLITTAAFHEKKIVGLHLWFHYNNYLYSHLAASSEIGYKCRASYAIYNYVINSLVNYEFIDLGGISGYADNAQHGLAKFKSGFSNETRKGYICGKILNQECYAQLIRGKKFTQMDYFPLYRSSLINS